MSIPLIVGSSLSGTPVERSTPRFFIPFRGRFEARRLLWHKADVNLGAEYLSPKKVRFRVWDSGFRVNLLSYNRFM